MVGYASSQNIVNRCLSAPPNTFINDNNSCQKYFLCHENGTTVSGSCDLPYLFNYPKQSCDYPENVACPAMCPPVIPSYFNYAVVNSCSQFMRCVNGIATIMECTDQLLFDPIKHECNFASEVNCNVPDVVCPINSNPNNPTFVVDKQNCSMYEKINYYI